MKKQTLLVLLVLACVVALMLPITVSAETQNGFVSVGDGYQYYRDGQLVTNEVIEHEGEWYAFDDSGRMYADGAFHLNDNWYRAREDGTLYVNEWYQDPWDDWYYYAEEGKAPYDFLQVGGYWYYFFGDGAMATDTVVWSYDYQNWYQISEDGASSWVVSGWVYQYEDWFYYPASGEEFSGFQCINGVWYYFRWNRMLTDCVVEEAGVWYALSEDGANYLPLSDGWNYAFGKWVVLEDGDPLVETLIEYYNGDLYYAKWNGFVAADEIVEFYEGETWKYAIADADGVLSYTGWTDKSGKWKYLSDGDYLRDGVYEIDGVLYMFDWEGRMNDIPGTTYGEYGDYFITPGGALRRNEWYWREITYPDDIGWVYYGDNGAMYQGGVYEVNGVQYAFTYGGALAKNTVMDEAEGVYVVDANGVATLVDGWFKHPSTNGWMYAKEGDLAEGIMEYGDDVYAFESGFMCTGTYWDEYNNTYGSFLFGEDGVMITETGWVLEAGKYYYINEDHTLFEGWLDYYGTRYYMAPDMAVNRAFYVASEKKSYLAREDGTCVELALNGLQNINNWIVYVEDGVVAIDTWKYIGGYWYYFNDSGDAYFNGTYYLSNERYLFLEGGKLAMGWTYHNNDWYYADPAKGGALVTDGVYEIDGELYAFSGTGWTYENQTYTYDNVCYLVDTAGKATALSDGWNYVGGKWYYVENGYAYRGLREINGAQYFFDNYGAMYADRIYDCYLLAPSGEVLTGWQWYNGAWVYGDPESGYLYSYFCDIDGKEYFFDGYYLKTGVFTYGDWLYTTDASGAIIDQERLEEGWIYDEVSHTWYYSVKGQYSYEGWLGDYYISYGEMLYDTIMEYNGQQYYLKPDGTVLKNGWYQRDERNWLYADASGALACSEWVNLGAWYYFYGYNMAQDGVYEIDGEYHKFRDDGVWLGEEEESAMEEPPIGLSGWQKFDGDWYYYVDGYPLTGAHYIDGANYYFGYKGRMYEDEYRYNYGLWYYGADGKRVDGTGWQYLNGSWVYFNPDHTLANGLFNDGTGYYYFGEFYDEDAEAWYYGILTDTYLEFDGRLFYFAGNGYSAGPITQDGWYYGDGLWYYVSDGATLREGVYNVDGAYYYFGDSGYAYTETWAYYDNGYRYFDSTGAMVTATGWYQDAAGDWHYVDEQGYMVHSGIYMIDGQQYTFRYGYMV